jgi:hypothetical protein
MSINGNKMEVLRKWFNFLNEDHKICNQRIQKYQPVTQSNCCLSKLCTNNLLQFASSVDGLFCAISNYVKDFYINKF